MFYDRKCPLDATFKVNTYSNEHFNFKIEAFDFIKVQKSIRIHCKLLVCKTNTTSQDCQQECAEERKRRDVEEVASVAETADIETTFKIVYRTKKTCRDIRCPPNSKCLQVRVS